MRSSRLAAVVALTVATSPAGVLAEHPCSSPLILDLNGDGVRTVGLNWAVKFDINADGRQNTLGWTFKGGEEGFLWIDYNRNGVVDDASELFGDSTLLPDGTFAEHGFEALAVFDRVEFGGDEDGLVTPRDLIWSHLRLWIDSNGDGVSQRDEIFVLAQLGVEAIGLEFEVVNELDGGGNLHTLRGAFIQKVRSFGRPFTRTLSVDDVVFVTSGDSG